MERCVCRSTWSAIDARTCRVPRRRRMPGVPCDDDPGGPWCVAEVLPCHRVSRRARARLRVRARRGDGRARDPTHDARFTASATPPPPLILRPPSSAPPVIPSSHGSSSLGSSVRQVSWRVASAFPPRRPGATCATARASCRSRRGRVRKKMGVYVFRFVRRHGPRVKVGHHRVTPRAPRVLPRRGHALLHVEVVHPPDLAGHLAMSDLDLVELRGTRSSTRVVAATRVHPRVRAVRSGGIDDRTGCHSSHVRARRHARRRVRGGAEARGRMGRATR